MKRYFLVLDQVKKVLFRFFLLKQYTGENKPKIKSPRDTRRTFADEFSKKNQNKLISW